MVGALAVAPRAHALPGPAWLPPVADQVSHSSQDAAVLPARLTSPPQPMRVERPVHVVRTMHTDLTKRAANAVLTADVATTYTVQPGDTLSGIANQYYGQADAWPQLYQANEAQIGGNPNLIFPGQVLSVPVNLPAVVQGTVSQQNAGPQPFVGSLPTNSPSALTTGLQGTLGCAGLEALWVSAGGLASAEVTAASIAMAESSGNQYATGPFGERGYWQINPIWGALSTYDALGNAQAAVQISNNGSDWTPWTTFVDGAYAGQC